MASPTPAGRRYRILGTIGRGGFGTVYRAELLGESGFKRQVALKVLNADMESVRSVAPRLRDEARLLGMLSHRSIVKVDGLVRLNERWTVVMEFVDGVDLGKAIHQGAIPQGPALEIMGEVAGALHVAYATPGPSGDPLRLLHRDIKPQNILVTPTGDVKVLDFGIARAEFEGREAQTRAMLLGSLAYMAPERYEHEEGPPADVYAMGVLLYEMLTGEGWGRASTKPDKYAAHRAEMLGRLKGSFLAIDPVVAFIAQMTEFDAGKRPSARDVERRCRELRLEVRGQWLRDWAEEVLPDLVPSATDLEPHDFPSDIISESTSAATPELVEGGWPADHRAEQTLPPDEEVAPVARPRSSPGPVDPHAAESAAIITADVKRRSASPTFVPGLDDDEELQALRKSRATPEPIPRSVSGPTMVPALTTFDGLSDAPPPLPADAAAVRPAPLEPEPPAEPIARVDRPAANPMALWLQVVGLLGVPVALAVVGAVLVVGLAGVMCCFGALLGA